MKDLTGVQTNALKVKPQYLTFLTMIYVTLTLSGCPVLYKIVHVGFINAPGGLVPLPFVLLLEDVIAEVYGYRISRVLLWYLLISMLLFIFMVEFIIHMPSPAYWHGEQAYLQVFGKLDTGVPIMVFGIFSGRFLNLFVITKLKILVKGRYFWIRSVFACLAGDVISLAIIYGWAFSSAPFSTQLHLFASDMFVRVCYSIVGGFFGVLLVAFLKNRERLDVYDYFTNFNPFRLSVQD